MKKIKKISQKENSLYISEGFPEGFPIVEVRNLKKVYKSGDSKLVVLNNLSFSLEKGRIASIMGKSGSGKSTLLYLLGGLLLPTDGIIKINGVNINHFHEEELARFRNRHIGFIFQFHHLLSEFTVLENVIIPGMILGVDEDKLIKRARELLEKLEILNREKHKPEKLSGGECQRVAIARALINNPDIILADEPTGDLDLETADKTKDILFEIVKKYRRSMVVVTHNHDIVKEADDRYMLEHGVLNPLLDNFI